MKRAVVVLANNAADQLPAASMKPGLMGSPMRELIGDPQLLSELVDGGYHLPVCEIVINREP